MKLIAILLSMLGVALCMVAQEPAGRFVPQVAPRSAEELDEMFAPIALYPDPLLAELLPAATFPGEIVLAARYLNRGGDPDLVDQQGWDPSVAALSRYPDVLNWMDENLSWTMAVGETFLNQQQDVINCIQRLRARAQALGNLQSTPEATVLADDGIIEILPSNPEVIYVPEYNSQVIYIHSSSGQGFINRKVPSRIGSWLNHDFDWPNRRLIVWSPQHQRPAAWWSYSASKRDCLGPTHAKVWHRHGHNQRGPGGSNPEPTSFKAGVWHPQSTLTVIGGKFGSANRGGATAGAGRSGAGGRESQSAGSGVRGTSGSAGATQTGGAAGRSPASASRSPGPAPMPSSK